MIYKLIEDENGQYVDSNGMKYTLLEASTFIDSPEGHNVGVVEFNTIGEAMAYYNITLIPGETADGK